MDEGSRREDLAVHVRREHVFEDSFRELHRRPPEEWKNRFYIVFEGKYFNFQFADRSLEITEKGFSKEDNSLYIVSNAFKGTDLFL